jgi:hypothetical protein
MIAVAVRALTYQPKLTELIGEFRPWHVESLLNQAADIIDKCLMELKEYNSLNYAWHQSSIELNAQQKEILQEQARNVRGYMEREAVTAEMKRAFYDESANDFNLIRNQQSNLRQQGEPLQRLQAEQGYYEGLIESYKRHTDKGLLERQKQWAEEDKIYNENLRIIHSEVVTNRVELSKDGKPFDLDSQCRLIFDRIEAYYKDAVNRALVAEAGLKSIYGKTDLVSVSPPSTSLNENLSHIAKWVHSAIAWLVAYQQLDQSFTRVVSMHSILAEEEWNELTQAQDQFRTMIKIPRELFANHENVRLRGLGASFVGEVGIVPWTVILTPPQKASYRRGGEYEPIDQRDLPSCLLGRVENRNSFRPLEIAGLISLMNASPVGEEFEDNLNHKTGYWAVEIIKPRNTSEAFLKIQDILLEINAVGVPNRMR